MPRSLSVVQGRYKFSALSRRVLIKAWENGSPLSPIIKRCTRRGRLKQFAGRLAGQSLIKPPTIAVSQTTFFICGGGGGGAALRTCNLTPEVEVFAAAAVCMSRLVVSARIAQNGSIFPSLPVQRDAIETDKEPI